MAQNLAAATLLHKIAQNIAKIEFGTAKHWKFERVQKENRWISTNLLKTMEVVQVRITMQLGILFEKELLS
jgi:hypothetical protein